MNLLKLTSKPEKGVSLFLMFFSILGIMISTKPSNAITIGQIDQENLEDQGVGFIINGCCKYVGQTYKAGLTGILTGVNVDIYTFTSNTSTLNIAIHKVLNGVPTSQILSETLVIGGSSIENFIRLPQEISQTSGEMYAIVASYKNAPPEEIQGNWQGTAQNQYINGFAFATNDFNSFFDAAPDIDVRFRTFVTTPVPEPTTILGSITALGLGVCLKRKLKALA